MTAGCQVAFDNAVDDASRAQKRVEIAAGPIITGEIDRVLAEAAEAHAAFEAKMAVVDHLTNLMTLGSPERARMALMRPPLPPGVSPPDRSKHPAVAAWREAHAALMVDPDAPLP
jgi:hypothetical protein